MFAVVMRLSVQQPCKRCESFVERANEGLSLRGTVSTVLTGVGLLQARLMSREVVVVQCRHRSNVIQRQAAGLWGAKLLT